MIADVESFDLVDGTGSVVTCSRSTNRDLFTLAIGGYGLFGVIARVTLRLAPRRKVERRVVIANLHDLRQLFEARIADGFGSGDFQFATAPDSEEFLRSGVFSCYRPVEDDRAMSTDLRSLTDADWKRLLLLAHVDKRKAFAEYARHYMSTDGQIYWSDTHQLASYLDGYHSDIDRQLGATVKGSEMISELYVKREDLSTFMDGVRDDARRSGMNIIYGTIRLIERDDESVLAWAREPWACIVFNLHVDHCPDGYSEGGGGLPTADRSRRRPRRQLLPHLSPVGDRPQVERCHPRMHEFLERKRAYDPRVLFTSDWYQHHVRLLHQDATDYQRAFAS